MFVIFKCVLSVDLFACCEICRWDMVAMFVVVVVVVVVVVERELDCSCNIS